MSISIKDFINDFKSNIINISLNNGSSVDIRKDTLNIYNDSLTNEIWVSCKDVKDCFILIKYDSIIGFFEVLFQAPPEYVGYSNNESLKPDSKEYSFTRRIANNKNLDTDKEGGSFNNEIFQDPIDRVKELAKKKIEENRSLKQAISSHMSNTDLSEVKINYAVPSFKKRP